MARRVLHDEYFKKAKAEGYLARSAYKLKELQQRFRLIKRASSVLDLGCAPGSWIQVTAEILGKDGAIVGVDLKPVEVDVRCSLHTAVQDITTLQVEPLLALVGGPFDTVLSDIAPNTSGHGDDLVSAHLCRSVLEIASRTLRPDGTLAMKIFDGAEYQSVLEETRALFRQAKGHKPRATRDPSREMYIVARGFRGPGPSL